MSVTGLRGNASRLERPMCQFYLRGTCRFGTRCRNNHSSTSSSQHETAQHGESPRWLQVGLAITRKVSPSPPPATSSAGQNSVILSDKTCGICFDTIMEKPMKRDQTFAILPNCNHCFCFPCIRKWRRSKEFDSDVSKSCPECRQVSNYVYRSKVWFDQPEKKTSFILKANDRMQLVNCRYFNKGQGVCPFGNTCLYRHALSNGSKVDVGPPKPRRPRPPSIDEEMLQQIMYWFNDEDDEDRTTDDDDYDNFELDLDDPLIAMQYYDHDDFRRYIAMERLMMPDSDTDSDIPYFLP